MKCKFHPRTKAKAICATCGAGLCGQCRIEDRGRTYCDNCYCSDEAERDDADAVHAHEASESED